MSVHLSTRTAEQGTRAATRPNSLTRFGMHVALIGRPCSLCLLPTAYDGLQGAARVAGSADLGHRVPVSVCGSWSPSYVGRQCRACNVATGTRDVSAWWVSAPWSYVPRPVAKAMRATFVYEDSTDLPDADARRAARAARGMDF